MPQSSPHPYKAAVLPLQKNKLGALASEIHADLAKYFPVDYDETGSIGKRYRRQDEIGTPFTICVDRADSSPDSADTARQGVFCPCCPAKEAARRRFLRKRRAKHRQQRTRGDEFPQIFHLSIPFRRGGGGARGAAP